MNDKIFLDTNILVYCYSVTDQLKQRKAVEIASKPAVFVSTQVLQELCNIITRKFKFGYEQAATTIKECCHNNNLHTNTENTVLPACQIADQNGFSFYDSMIVAAAIESNCTVLYSEDLQDGQVIDGKLTVKNPFIS